MNADAVVIGAGPNGLAAAIALARRGRGVAIFEAAATPGGGCRSAELTLPGFVHDVCSAFHPLAAASPFFGELDLGRHGLQWIHPGAPLAHPLDDGSAVLLERSVDETSRNLGVDGAAYRRLVGTVAADWARLVDHLLGPMLRLPRHPLALVRFGIPALLPAAVLARVAFRGERARALFAGCAAHSFLALETPLSASFGLVLAASAHAVGWPFPRGGSERLVEALVAELRAHGGTIECGRPIRSFSDLPPARAYLFDLTPWQVDAIAADRLPMTYRRALRRYRYGPGIFKVDYALDGPIPWRAPECLRAGTVHVGGSLADIAESERAVARGAPPERPFVLVGQQSLFDPTRAPAGKHTVWAYCHVPNGSDFDMTERIDRQIERFAPGFLERVVARAVMTPQDVERHNENNIGGDISAGSHAGPQLFARPTVAATPYVTPARDIYLCSASTPPGAGVHGMCGYHAAQAAMRRSLRGTS